MLVPFKFLLQFLQVEMSDHPSLGDASMEWSVASYATAPQVLNDSPMERNPNESWIGSQWRGISCCFCDSAPSLVWIPKD